MRLATGSNLGGQLRSNGPQISANDQIEPAAAATAHQAAAALSNLATNEAIRVQLRLGASPLSLSYTQAAASQSRTAICTRNRLDSPPKIGGVQHTSQTKVGTQKHK